MNWLKSVADSLKSAAVIWGSLVAFSAWVASYYNDCQECIDFYRVEIGLALLTIATSMIIWFAVQYMFKVNAKRIDTVEGKIDGVKDDIHHELNSIQRAMLRGDVDRFFKDHKDDDYLTEDEASYVYMLRDKLKHHNVNSFTQRKVEHLLAKQVKDPEK